MYYYLEYRNDSGKVDVIHEKVPNEIKNGYSVAMSDVYPPGMEHVSDITIYAVDKETNIVTSSGTTVNIEQAVQLINKVVEVQLENTSLQKRVDDITIAIAALMGGAV